MGKLAKGKIKGKGKRTWKSWKMGKQAGCDKMEKKDKINKKACCLIHLPNLQEKQAIKFLKKGK